MQTATVCARAGGGVVPCVVSKYLDKGLIPHLPHWLERYVGERRHVISAKSVERTGWLRGAWRRVCTAWRTGRRRRDHPMDRNRRCGFGADGSLGNAECSWAACADHQGCQRLNSGRARTPACFSRRQSGLGRGPCRRGPEPRRHGTTTCGADRFACRHSAGVAPSARERTPGSTQGEIGDVVGARHPCSPLHRAPLIGKRQVWSLGGPHR